MAVSRLKITDAADQKFDIVVNGQRVGIRLRNNVSIDRWSVDVSINDALVLGGVRVVSDADLLEPYALGIGSLYAGSGALGSTINYNTLTSGEVGLYHAI